MVNLVTVDLDSVCNNCDHKGQCAYKTINEKCHSHKLLDQATIPQEKPEPCKYISSYSDGQLALGKCNLINVLDPDCDNCKEWLIDNVTPEKPQVGELSLEQEFEFGGFRDIFDSHCSYAKTCEIQSDVYGELCQYTESLIEQAKQSTRDEVVAEILIELNDREVDMTQDEFRTGFRYAMTFIEKLQDTTRVKG